MNSHEHNLPQLNPTNRRSSDRTIDGTHSSISCGTNHRQIAAIDEASFPKPSNFVASSSASGFLRWYYQEVALSERLSD